MLNRATNPYSAPPAGAAESRVPIDLRPNLRLGVLLVGCALAMTAIAFRLVHVQTSSGTAVVAEFERTVEKHEPIASRDGRILSADGQVLAEDVAEFSLKVHYRWLEEPVNPAWLRQQALSRLDRAARRDAARVAAEEAALLANRQAGWHRLSQQTRIDSKELGRRRREIQRRVERIYRLVSERRAGRRSENEGAAPQQASTTWWAKAWDTVVAALTTAPEREELEPVVVREQLDYHELIEELPTDAAIEIESHPERYPGTRIDMTTRRVYPQRTTAAHLVGYRTAVGDEALRERHERLSGSDPLDYRLGDRRGRTGLERYYEGHLRGLRGERRAIFNRRGELLREEVVREPRYGRDLVLSLHLPLQQAAEQLLDDALAQEKIDEATGKPLPIPPGGAIVALDVRTGAVLAAASAPRFDLSLFSEPDAARWRETADDPRQPLFHRAAEMALAPGSTFKIVSAIALLESGRLDPEQVFSCQGFLDTPERYRCFTYRHFGVGHGAVNLTGALARSCNVYFFAGARKLGVEPLVEWAARFGFGRGTGIDLPSESAGTVPPGGTGGLANLPPLGRGGKGGARGARSPRPSSGEALQLAIGQGRLTATPLQVARMIAAVANGGRLVTLRLADLVDVAVSPRDAADDEGTFSASESPAIPELSTRSLVWVQHGLQQVVAHPQGTGYKTVRLQGASIAGKTGTAEPGGGKPDHAWFAGYVPAENPRIAFVVVLEHAGPGGHAAGPLAREFVEALVALGLLGEQPIAGPLAN